MNLSSIITGVPEYIEVADVPANPTVNAQLIPANTLTILQFSDIVQDTGSLASLGSNRITIPAGTYYYEILAGVGRTNTDTPVRPILGLWNYTDSEWISRSEIFNQFRLAAIDGAACFLSGQFKVSAQTALEVKIIVRTESRMRPAGIEAQHTESTSGALQRQTIKLWKLK